MSAVLTIGAATLILPGRAAAVEPGFQVDITELPETFTAGDGARTVTVVASSEQNRCQKVRWSLLIAVDGPDLDEVEVARIEDNGDFPIQVQNAGDDSARITDVQLDPGQLCRGRTVTARYRIGFDEDADSGRVTFRAQAFNAGRTLLQEASSRSQVAGEEAEESPSPEAGPSPSESSPAPEESATDEETAEPEPTSTEEDVAAVPAAGSDSGTPSLLGAGLIVGGILVFLGVGLLLRLRMRSRAPKHSSQLPTGFYPAN
ncbi:hypothetical protein [Actinoplanes sp. NPDC049599]|uniref:hypothetical protein n=1 Tax=Actinoplanes sp. NPDC049599 TaxID=3363903 RepID=UPI0037A0BCE9